MKSLSFAPSEVTWLRAFTFSIYGTSVLIYTYLPLYYAYLGFSKVQIGYLFAIGPLISLFSNLLWSFASDKYRTIKKIMMVLLVGQIITTLVISSITSFSFIMILMALFYFFFYPIYPLADTMAITTTKKLGQNFTVIRIFGSLGFAFFAIITGYVLSATGTSKTLVICMTLSIMSLGLSFSTPRTKPAKQVK